jgi:MYXO-CTERM domain-containing protein
LKGNTYDFTMSFVQPLSGAVSSTQVSAQLLAKSQSTPELIQYSLYSGTPGSGSFLSQSTLDYSPTISFTPAVGDYYVELDYVAKINETVGGTITTASAPEPAAWAIMLVGFGALGGVMRRRNSMAAKFAA